MDNKIIETEKARIWLRDEGITVIEFKPGAEVNLANIKENFAVHRKLSQGKRIPVFTDVTGVKYMERAARVYSSGEEANKDIEALAVLVNSPLSRVLGSIFIGLNKPLYPFKLVSSEKEAIKWLKGFVKSEKDL